MVNLLRGPWLMSGLAAYHQRQGAVLVMAWTGFIVGTRVIVNLSIVSVYGLVVSFSI